MKLNPLWNEVDHKIWSFIFYYIDYEFKFNIIVNPLMFMEELTQKIHDEMKTMLGEKNNET